MNELEKRAYRAFLGLYLVSSLLFMTLLGYWYYTAQKRSLESAQRYRLEHVADRVGSAVIVAHMHRTPLSLPSADPDIAVALFDAHGHLRHGTLPVPIRPEKTGYFRRHGYSVLVSDSPNDHLGIHYVVVESDALAAELAALRANVLGIGTAVALLIMLVAWTLARIFMRPVREKFQQIERFVNDITHELNTPISALTMTTEQALKRGECTQKNLRNLTVSTRQLYDIYRALTYLNFSKKDPDPAPVDLEALLQKSADYYRPLCESKRIDLQVRTRPLVFAMPPTQAQLLFGNLIGNAVKYSPPGSTLTLSIENGCVVVADEGAGIDPALHDKIFERYTRATDSAGGFGVGLSIVKRLCDDYGIALSLDSAVGQGTTFRLCFDTV